MFVSLKIAEDFNMNVIQLLYWDHGKQLKRHNFGWNPVLDMQAAVTIFEISTKYKLLNFTKLLKFDTYIVLMSSYVNNMHFLLL